MNFVRTGFRTVRSNPALAFAEIAWRWTYGAVAWLIAILAFRTILSGVDISDAEATMAHTSDAFRIADALARVLVQVLPRFLEALIVIIPLLAVIWVVTATVGRAATLSALNRSDRRGAGFQPAVPQASSRRVVSLTALNILRAVFTITTLLAFCGTVFLVSAQFTSNLSPEIAPALVFGWLLLALLVGILWGIVNWFLALAPIFVVQDRVGAWKSISESLRLYRRRPREYLAIASVFGLIRTAALIFAMIAGLIFVAAGSVRAGLITSAVVALAYFAVADCLYIARLAAYFSLANVREPPVILTAPAAVSIPQPSAPYTETET